MDFHCLPCKQAVSREIQTITCKLLAKARRSPSVLVFPYPRDLLDHHVQGTNTSGSPRRPQMAFRLGRHGDVLGWGVRNPLLADAGSADHLSPPGKWFFLPRCFSPVDVDGCPADHWFGHPAGMQAAQGFSCFSAFDRGICPALRGRIRSWARTSSCLDRMAFPGEYHYQSRRLRHGIRPPEELSALPQGESN